jgi:hypothetical protein
MNEKKNGNEWGAGPLRITISGRQGAGKTEMARWLKWHLEKIGHEVSHLEEGQAIDWTGFERYKTQTPKKITLETVLADSDSRLTDRWAKQSPELKREKARERMRRWRRTEKGEESLKADTLRMRAKIGAAPRGFWKCLECGAEEEKHSAIAAGWKHVRYYKGFCGSCCDKKETRS